MVIYNRLECCKLLVLHFVICSTLFWLLSLRPYIKENAFSVIWTVTSLSVRTSRRTVSLKRDLNHGNLRQRSVVIMATMMWLSNSLTHSLIQSLIHIKGTFGVVSRAGGSVENYQRVTMEVAGTNCCLEKLSWSKYFVTIHSPTTELRRYWSNTASSYHNPTFFIRKLHSYKGLGFTGRLIILHTDQFLRKDYPTF